MLTLCGFPISNYFNKVKLVLLEKGLPFQEHNVGIGRSDEEVLAASPLGKIPYLLTPQGPLCESAVICEWIEASCPQPALMPAEPYAAAKVRELHTFLDLHLEWVARDLYKQAFFGGTVDAPTQQRVRKQLERAIPAFQRLARFSPYVAGDAFTLADAAAWVHLPLVGTATKAVLGDDLLLAAGLDWKAYAALIQQRPAAQKVAADRKAALGARPAA